jgi:hypothetical protein
VSESERLRQKAAQATRLAGEAVDKLTLDRLNEFAQECLAQAAELDSDDAPLRATDSDQNHV